MSSVYGNAMSALVLISEDFLNTQVFSPFANHYKVNEELLKCIYRNKLLKPFFKKLKSDEKATGWFQHDGATCHIANLTEEVLEEVFDTRLTSKPKWTARSPDLTPPDFFLWSMLKGRVYEKNPPDLSALKLKIKREIDKITEAQLSDVLENLKKRLHMCESENGKHFQHLM